MAHTRSERPRRPVALAAAVAIAAFGAASCGGTTSPTPAGSPSPSASPVATASPSPSPSPSASPSSSSVAAAVDPAKDLRIADPYTLVELDPAVTQNMRNRMSASIGAFGNLFSIGLREITGGTGIRNVLIVIGFPTGMLDEAGYGAVLNGITASMNGAKLTKTSVSGVNVSSGTIPQGAMAAFHLGDRFVVVVSSGATDALPIARAIISANPVPEASGGSG